MWDFSTLAMCVCVWVALAWPVAAISQRSFSCGSGSEENAPALGSRTADAKRLIDARIAYRRYLYGI